MHLTKYLERNAARYPNKLAIATDERQMSWRELWNEVVAGSDFLAQQLPRSDKQLIVAILMPNSWQYVVAYLSILHAGHMAMPIDVIFKPLEIEAVLNQLPPALVVTDKAGSLRLNNPSAPVVLAEDFPAKAQAGRDYLRLPADEQIASLLFTSGTTGKPKIVPYTHAIHTWNVETCSKVWKWNTDDSLLISLRLSHMYGLVLGLSGVLYHGNTMYLQDRFDALATLKLLSSGKVSIFTHGPLVYARLADVPHPERFDLSGVRLFISGSGPLAPSLWHKFKKLFGAEILEVYGTTETGRIASNLLNQRISGSPGPVLPGVKVKFDEHGQVLVKSGGVISGYFNNPQATRRARTDDGFWRTGDIGELHDGRLILKGRLQERIRKQGYTVSPRDVEWALHQDQRIKEVLVMGAQRSDSAGDDSITYFLAGDISEQQVREFCAENLPSVWRPDRVIILDSLPRNRSGKPQLGKLKAMLN